MSSLGWTSPLPSMSSSSLPAQPNGCNGWSNDGSDPTDEQDAVPPPSPKRLRGSSTARRWDLGQRSRHSSARERPADKGSVLKGPWGRERGMICSPFGLESGPKWKSMMLVRAPFIWTMGPALFQRLEWRAVRRGGSLMIHNEYHDKDRLDDTWPESNRARRCLCLFANYRGGGTTQRSASKHEK